MAKKNIAVLGAGMMGTGIAQLFASKGHKVMLIYVYDDKLRAKPVETMRGNLQVLVEQGVMEESQISPSSTMYVSRRAWKRQRSSPM